ncbi:MAG: HAD family hydrolase [Longimicrobiales bacterium]|nr:HAD family hydrolase [Longimicrobiales bacterium]
MAPGGDPRGDPPAQARLRPAVFLDRDGTLIREVNYLADPGGVGLIPGAGEALTLLRNAGFALVVVTNQSGIARGLFGVEDYEAVARRLDQLLASHGLTLDATYFCPHHPELSGDCPCRKPATGMHRAAAEALGLDLTRSFFVGDRVGDLLPALELGGEGVLVRTGYGVEEERSLPAAFHATDDVLEAARWILARG